MKKGLKKVISQSVTQTLLDSLFFGLKGVTLGLAIIFLTANIQLLSNISPLYFRLMNEDRTAAMIFIRQVRRYVSNFPFFLSMYQRIYGPTFVKETFVSDVKRDAEIEKFKQALLINPHDPEILYKLFLLFDQRGDRQEANNYLKQARDFDPSLN